MARGKGLTACFAPTGYPTNRPYGLDEGRGDGCWEGWDCGLLRRGGMNPLRRCAPRPPFASLRCAKRGGVVVSRAIWDPTSWLGGVLRG